VRAKAIATILAAATALIVLVVPASALGAAHHYRQPATVDAEIHLRGTNGFRFFALTFGDAAIISASKRASKFGEESVSYFARPQRGRPAFKDGILEMDLGKQGRFRGRFVAKSTKTRKPAGGCTGDPTTIEKGFFVGAFNFRGERGYSSIHAHRERGSVTRQGAARCQIPSEAGRQEEKQGAKEAKESAAHEFRLIAGDGTAQLVFQASREEPAQLEGETAAYYQVSAAGDKAGAFEVSRSAFVFEFPSRATPKFQVPNLAEPLAEAILAPPAPFSGTATFHLDDPQTASWTGDLAVDLPGLGKLPLTGGKIAAGLCHDAHCTKTLPESLQRLLEASRNDGSSYVTVGIDRNGSS
jgi:hypothetical protein